jgi:arsenate reductase
MAEAFLRALAGDRVEVQSAGTEVTRVHPLAIRAMEEVGIDLGGHASKTLERFLGQPWDYVITVCDSANARCPAFPARTTRIHWSLDDPSQATGTEEERLKTFRRVRDQIKAKLVGWLTDQEVLSR